MKIKLDDIFAYNGDYRKFGLNLVARTEGNNVGSVSPLTLNQCAVGCNKIPECNSFAYCPGWGCHFKDKVIYGHEDTKQHTACTTFFKRQGNFVFFAHMVL